MESWSIPIPKRHPVLMAWTTIHAIICWNNMKTVKKGDLPEKVCPVCQRLFSWRKKWKENWDEVKYCSEKCRRSK
jgi:hypothetical protein